MIRRTLADLLAARESAGGRYLEFVREESMSVGIYVLTEGGVDRQLPHNEDEVYVVLRGRGRFTAGDETVDVEPGDTLFVPRRVPHRFHDIAAELVLAVVFAPPEST